MKKELKFNNKVVVLTKGFYQGARGVVIDFDGVAYQVLLAGNVTRSFYGENLKLLTKGASSGK